MALSVINGDKAILEMAAAITDDLEHTLLRCVKEKDIRRAANESRRSFRAVKIPKPHRRIYMFSRGSL